MSKTLEIIAENLQSKICTGTANKMDSDADNIDSALEYVKDFIIKRKLILFGGQAIDYALRLKGSFLYPNDLRPDYDFLSDNSVEDAYDLADLLISKGFVKVDVVRGLHVQTMRVRVNVIPVADVGFVPSNIFKKLPTFDYMGMRIITPTYQRADMHIPMSLPFTGAPKENCFHRWKKDIKRLNLFQKFFPIEYDKKIEIKISKIKCNIQFEPDGSKLAIHGFTAYAIIYGTLSELIGASNVPKDIIKMTCKINNKSIETDHPVLAKGTIDNLPLFATPNVHEFFKVGVKYKKFLDAINEIYLYNGALYLSVEDEMMGISRLKTKSTGEVVVVTPHAIMVWLIIMSVRDNVNANVYLAFYDSLFKILSVAERYYYTELNSLLGIPKQNEKMKIIMDEYLKSPFVPSAIVMGKHNVSTAYLIMCSMVINKLKDTPPDELNLPSDITKIIDDLPQNYYPETGSRPPITEFNNELFKHNGEKIVIS